MLSKVRIDCNADQVRMSRSVILISMECMHVRTGTHHGQGKPFCAHSCQGGLNRCGACVITLIRRAPRPHRRHQNC